MQRTPSRRRSWLFIGGADHEQLAAAPASSTDVAILELEDFTAPSERPAARASAPRILAAWRYAGVETAVRVNPLADDGMADLAAVMEGAPDLVLLPKVDCAEQVVALDEAVTRLESRYGLPEGATGVVPNIESALGIMHTFAIAQSSPRIAACLMASEDLATDLGAERGRDAVELSYARQRFLLECCAAKVLAIDCPYTWVDHDGLRSDTLYARRLGYRAKCTVDPSHAAVINDLFTPSSEDLLKARRVVDAFETARASGAGRVELDGSLVELPIYLNARRLLERG
jgi:citrate lyase subunit beta/citryl-CoA lyase